MFNNGKPDVEVMVITTDELGDFAKAIRQRRDDEERASDRWRTTVSGVRFYPFAPRAEDVRLNDIAHSLAFQCRFSGHTRQFYSVAEHSVRVFQRVLSRRHMANDQQERFLQVCALLHDAPEAYLGDTPGPIKPSTCYHLRPNLVKGQIPDPEKIVRTVSGDEAETAIGIAILEALYGKATPPMSGKDWHTLSKAVSDADHYVLLHELRDLVTITPGHRYEAEMHLVAGEKPIHPLTPEMSRSVFLDYARNLFIGEMKRG